MTTCIMRIAAAFVTIISWATPALCQGHSTERKHGTSTAFQESRDTAPQGLFDVRVFGAFLDLMRKGDHAAKVMLDDARLSRATVAVGALSGLRGEITMIDRRVIVTYGGQNTTHLPSYNEAATLLGVANVKEWASPIPLPIDLTGKALDHFIIEQAKSAGLDASHPFPVKLKGILIQVAMHVIEAPNPKFSGHGAKESIARQDEFHHEAIAGEVIGFYAPEKMQGILSHPGDYFHFHWLDQNYARTAHLDKFGLRAGSVLFLPKP